MNILNFFQLQWTDILDIGILSLLIYNLILLLQGTRSFQILLGVFALAFLYYICVFLDLRSILWVYQNVLQYTVILIVIIFQSDIRKALANFGKTGIFKRKLEHSKYVKRIMKAIIFSQAKKIGLIIAFEKNISLGEYIKTGVELQAMLTSSLILSIFSKNSPLHDGAVVVSSKYKVTAAGCIFPLSNRIDLDPSYGTRHRAAMGLSEITDAVIITVSEETGRISLFFDGEVKKNIKSGLIENFLNNYLKHNARARKG